MNLNLARCLRSNALLRLGSVRSYNNVQADNEWDRMIKEAEDVVGGHSFRNVEVLLNNETVEMTGNFMSANQPLLDAPRNSAKSNDIPLGLVALLFAKAAQRKPLYLENQLCPVTGVLHSQYIVSKVTELLKLSFRIHKRVYDAKNLSREMNDANRITILSGDYILSECLRELAGLPDHFILDYMASAYRDLIFSRHLGITDERNGPVPSKPSSQTGTALSHSYLDEFSCDPILFPNALGDAKAEWSFRTVLGGGSLLAKSCLSCLRLADYPEYSQNIGFSFGKSFALAFQAHRDLSEFLAKSSGRFSLVSAPFLFQLQSDAELYKKIENAEAVDFDFLRGAVMNGPGIEKTMTLQNEYLKSAADVLDIMGESRAQAALKKLVSFIAGRF